MGRRRNKNKKNIRSHINKSKMGKEKLEDLTILFGFYVGHHHINYYDTCIDRYICAVKSRHLITVGSYPIFESGFVKNNKENEFSYVLKKGGKKSIKLDIYGISDSDFNDLGGYCEKFNLKIEKIETLAGDVHVLISNDDLVKNILISDDYEHDHHLKKLEKNN